MNDFEDIWEIILNKIGEDTTQIMFDLYPKALKFEKYENDTVYLSIDKEFKKKVIDDKFRAPITQLFEDTLGFPVKLEIIVINPDLMEENQIDGIIAENTQQKLTARYTFENFITGSENNLAYNIALAASKQPGMKYNPVFIYGASGLGKTHLLFAAYNKIMENNPNAKVVITSYESYYNELLDCIKTKTQSEFHQKYRNLDALFIDDIQFIIRAGTQLQEDLFHTIDTMYQNRKQIFIVSDRPPKDMSTLEERLRSRFNNGIIQDILPPDKDTRIAIINKKAEQMDLRIPASVTEFIADKIQKNVRQLEGVVNKIEAIKTINNGVFPSSEKIREIINEVTNDNQPASVIIEKILERVSTDMEVPIEEIKSKKRDKKIKDARQISIYIIRQRTNMTLSEIGDIFGLSHSTVLHAIEQIEKEKEAKPSLKILLDNIVNDF